MARYWFTYRADTGKPIDDPAAYRQVARSTVGIPACLEGSAVCAIYAPGTSGALNSLPAGTSFSANLNTYINSSITSSVPLPTAEGAKYFLYKRD